MDLLYIILSSEFEPASRIASLAPDERKSFKEFQAMIAEASEPIYQKFVNPLTVASPPQIEGFIDANASRAVPEFASTFLKLTKWFMDKPTYKELLAKASKPMETWTFSNSVYSAKSLEAYRQALLLEYDNEAYFMARYGDVIGTSSYASMSMALRWRGLDDEELSVINVRLYMAMWAAHIVVRKNQRKLRGTFDELTRLTTKFADEKDALISTIDFVLDQDMRVGLLRSKSQFETMVKTPV